jgi:transposase
MYSSRSTAIRVLRLLVKDKHAKWLSDLAREVNIVFNYCNELSAKVFERERAWFKEVDEAFSTQICSVCNSRAGPKGREGLGIRGWRCGVCAAVHDRDVNAAQNILAAGHRRLAEGILVP